MQVPPERRISVKGSQPDLAGRTAVITGAASGLGAAIARGMASAEANVVLVDTNESGLTATEQGVSRVAEPVA